MEVVADVLETECLLIVGKNCRDRELADLIVERIEGYMTAEKYVFSDQLESLGTGIPCVNLRLFSALYFFLSLIHI